MKRGKYRQAVFMATYSEKNEIIKYLILKRMKHWKGWEFPKGGIEKNETLNQTVKREIFEETGKKALKIKRINIKGKYNYKRKYPDRPEYDGQSYILFAVKINKGRIKIGDEHSDYIWLKFKDAVKKLTFRNQKKCLKIVNGWLEKEHHQRR